ncbi:MAG: SDR family oxidoreductase [Novosphingobium sp.]
MMQADKSGTDEAFAGGLADESTGHAIYPSLRDKHVLITGGGSGIGEAFVLAFVEHGSRVSFVDIAELESRRLVERLAPTARHPVHFHPCDLQDVDALNRTFDKIVAAHGPVEVLINNAANDDRHKIEEVTPQYWDQRIAVNLRHIFFATQAVIPAMRKAGRGVIINLSSISWHLGLPDLVLYQTAKAGIEGMTRGLAKDLGEYGIRVNAIVPGGVKTTRQDLLWHDPAEAARIVENQCIKGRVMPRDVAAMALFLSSDDARMCTAHSYFVDAGWR